ncbi:tetratricopeptide repeat protein [Elusimicrobiota bacterium]
MKTSTSLVALAVAAVAGSAALSVPAVCSAAPVAVAVAPIRIAGPKEGAKVRAKLLQESLIVALLQDPRLVVLDRLDVGISLREAGHKGAVNAKTAATAGEDLMVDYVVVGTLSSGAGGMSLALRAVPSGNPDPSAAVAVEVRPKSRADSQILGLSAQAAVALLKKFPGSLGGADEKILARVRRYARPTKSYSAYALYVRGRESYRLCHGKGFKDAIPLFKKAIVLDPKFALAHAALGENYGALAFRRFGLSMKHKHFAGQSRVYAQSALDLAPELAEPHRAMAVARFMAFIIDMKNNKMDSDPAPAQAEAQKALDLNPNDFQSQFVRASFEENPTASPYFKKSLQLNPSYVCALTDMSGMLINEKRHDEAIPYLQRVLRVNPWDSTTLLNLGMAHLARKENKLAVQAFKKSIRSNPTLALAYNNLAQAYDELGQTDLAVKTLERALEVNPRLPRAHYSLAQQYAKQKSWPQAVASFSRAAELDPDFGVAFYFLGLAHKKNGNVIESVKALQEAARLMPKDAEVHYDLGKNLFSAKRYAEAVKALNKCTNLSRGDMEMFKRVGAKAEVLREDVEYVMSHPE